MINGIERLLILSIFLVSCKTTENNATLSDSESQNNDKSPELVRELYNPTPQKRFDLIHTELDLNFHWENRQVIGKATLTLSPHFYPMDFIVFDAKNFTINSISMNENELSYEYDSLELIIDLENQYEKEDTLSLFIDYVANPYHDLPNGLDATTFSRGIYFINHDNENPEKPRQIWTYGIPENNSFWFPTLDQLNVRSRLDLKLTVDQNFQTISSGTIKSRIYHDDSTRTDHWILNKPYSPHLFSFVIGEFSKLESITDLSTLNFWTEPEFENEAKRIFGSSSEMVGFFSELLKIPFPWKIYDQVAVRDFFPGTAANASLSIFMEEIQEIESEENWEDLISNKLLNQWFGSLVNAESWPNLAAVRAIAAYGEVLWIEYKYGKENAEYKLINELDNYLIEASLNPVSLVKYDFYKGEEFLENYSDSKAIKVIHMLREYVGDEAFFEALQFFLKKNQYKTVEVHHLRQAFEEITGEDLNWFFDQWFYSKGHPELRVNHSFENDTLFIYVEQLQLEDSDIPVFRLPVYLDLFYDNATFRYPLVIENRTHKFRLPLSTKPEAIVVDGNYQLTGVMDHSKSDVELLNQYDLGDSFSARYESLVKLLNNPGSEIWNKMVRSGVKDSSEYLRYLTLEMLVGLEKNQLDNFKEEIMALVDDPSSSVRSLAFELLYNLDLPADFWYNNLNDTSLSVKGIVLDYLLSNNIQSDSLFNIYSKSKFIEELAPVSFYINENFKTGYVEWYLNKLRNLNKSEVYYLLQPFKEYLVDASYEEKVNAIPFLHETAINHINYTVRFSAYEILKAINNTDQVERILNEIRSLERDPVLIEIYSEE